MTEQSFGPEPPRKQTEWPAVVGVLGTLIIIATTIILLVKL
jgi:hypothetical protein